MIVDFQHHYIPRELLDRHGVQDKVIAEFNQDGAPRHLYGPLLGDLDAHIAMMDTAGIDVAVLSCNEGFDNPDLDSCRFINGKMKEAEDGYPGRFVSLASTAALGGAAAMKELERCVHEYGFPGIAIASEIQGRALDDPGLDALWETASRLGIYVFVHPLPGVIAWDRMDAGDLGRMVGWEFSLMVATLRLIQGGVLDRFPALKVQFSHFSGGIGRYLGRIKGFSMREVWGTAGNLRHGTEPANGIDHYLNQRLMYDCAGWAGPTNSAEWGEHWVRFGLLEVPTSRIVFATDYPQAIRDADEVRSYVEAVRAIGPEGEEILSGRSAAKLIPRLAAATA